jgi:hypothetical protein
MKEVVIEKNNTLLSCLNKVLSVSDEELKIVIPEDSILFKQKNNLKIFLKVVRNSGKLFKIETTSTIGKEFLKELNAEEDESPVFHDFVEKNEVLESTEEIEAPQHEKTKAKFNINFDFFNLKDLGKNSNKIYLTGGILLLVVILGFGGFYFINSTNQPNVVLKISAERFVKSFEVKLSSVSNTDIQNKVLRVSKMSQNYETSKEIPTTGKVDGGTKASGEIRFSNSTDKDITLSTDKKLVFKDSDKKELIFFLTKSITVPKRTLTSTNPDTYVNGEVVGEARASDFGSSYNISQGKNLSVESYESSELKAFVFYSFDDGLKTSLPAVSEEDLKNVSNLAMEDLKQNTQNLNQVGNVFLRNTQIYTITEQKFSHKLTEPTDILKLTQKVNLSYLQYNEQDAKNFVQALVSGLVPEGYELYGKDLQIEIGVLSLNSALGSPNDEATGQLTIRSYKMPVIDSNSIANNLSGKTVTEAKEYLDSLGIYYDIESNSLINILGFPKDVSKINVSVENQ